MLFRKMNEADLVKVCTIEAENFYTPWSVDQFKYELNENPYSNLWVLENDDNDIIGYYDLWIIFERAEIATIAVRKDYQSKGYGSKLMAHLENQAKQFECETIALEVRVSNLPAQNLYNKYDFSIINTKPGYYKTEDGYEDAYFMMKGI